MFWSNLFLGNVLEGMRKIMFEKKKNTMDGTKTKNSDLVYKMTVLNHILKRKCGVY